MKIEMKASAKAKHRGAARRESRQTSKNHRHGGENSENGINESRKRYRQAMASGEMSAKWRRIFSGKALIIEKRKTSKTSHGVSWRGISVAKNI
jgi:hypothetical protein